MAVEYFQSDWQMIGLRVTRTKDGRVELDLVHRNKGSVQTVFPMSSLAAGNPCFDEKTITYVLEQLVTAAGGILGEVVTYGR